MKYRKLRALSAVLASTLFFVVSCTGSAIVAGNVLVELDTRDIVEGDEPHRFFSVLAVTPDETRPVLLSELERFLKNNEDASLVLTPGHGESPGYSARTDDGRTHYTYNAVGANEQTVELHVTDFDHSQGTYRYIVRGKKITPTYSKQIHYLKAGLMALPYGLGIALLLNLIGKLLRWRLNRKLSSETASNEAQT